MFSTGNVKENRSDRRKLIFRQLSLFSFKAYLNMYQHTVPGSTVSSSKYHIITAFFFEHDCSLLLALQSEFHVHNPKPTIQNSVLNNANNASKYY